MRHVIITGGVRGIGRACAIRFLAEGWNVGVLDLLDGNPNPAERSPQLVTVAADVTDRLAVAAAIDQLVEAFGAPLACINAAGIYPMSTLESGSPELFRQIFDINVLGTFLTSQVAVRFMPEGGVIVNFASINAFAPKVDQILYGAAKAAVVQLTKTMAASLAARRIRVNAIAPGPVDTEGLRAIPGRLKEIAATVPLGRAATPEEMADLVWWLVEGKGAKYITGETIVASGGLLMR